MTGPMTDLRLAILFADGSMTVLAAAERPADAQTLCDELNAWEPRRDRQARLVRIAAEIVEDVVLEEPVHG